LVVFGGAGARADVLGESSLLTANGVLGSPVNEPVEFSFSVYNLDRWTGGAFSLPESERRRIFDRLPLGKGDVGDTIFVPAAEIPGAVELLTNGVNNVVYYELATTATSGNAAIRMESPFLFGAKGPRDRIDFAGYELTEIGVRVDKLRLNDPATGQYDFALTIVVIPEPSALALLGLGALALVRRRRVRF
jgi:hypothetical protein